MNESDELRNQANIAHFAEEREDARQVEESIAVKKKPIVIYHANCADGFAAAWVFWRAMKDGLLPELEFCPGVYGKSPPDVEGRLVYMVDFSYKSPIVADMLHSCKHLWLIDHHKTAIEDLVNNEEVQNAPNFSSYTDLERSGAMLAWDFLHNFVNIGDDIAESKPGDAEYIAPPKLLEHIQDRDLWRFKLPGTREIQADVFSHEYDFEQWDKLMNAGIQDLLNMRISGASILRKMDKDIKELLNVCKRYLTIGGVTVPVASLPYVFSSDAGHIMHRDYENGTKFAACYWDISDGRVFSLRSSDNGMDVSAIAKGYGGGGHRNASGFTVPRDHELARS